MTTFARTPVRTVFTLLVLVLSACGGQESKSSKTQVLVTIDSDIRADLSKVEVQVLDVRAEVAGSGHLFEVSRDEGWPISFAVSPSRGKESGSFLVVARGKDAQGEVLAESKGLLTFVKGKTTTAALWLLAACRGVMCAGLQTCAVQGAQAGMCGAVPVLDTEIADASDLASAPGGLPPTLTPPPEAPSSGPGTSMGVDPSTPGVGNNNNSDASVGSQPSADGGVAAADAGPDAATPAPVVPRVANTPTLGGFATLGEPRSAAGLLLLDDGFELGERVCNSAGLCATASFAP